MNRHFGIKKLIYDQPDDTIRATDFINGTSPLVQKGWRKKAAITKWDFRRKRKRTPLFLTNALFLTL